MGKVNARQTAILELIAEQGFVATDTLVHRFGVTPQTIRRDLSQLSETGRIARFHGGAGQAAGVRPYRDRRRSDLAAKRGIATACARRVPNGASLFLNIGTTTEAVAEALLEHSDLYIVTNSLHVARILSRNPSFTIMMSGGQVRNQDGGIVGGEAVAFMENFRADFGVIGISAIDADGTLLDHDAREVRIAQAIMRGSGQVLLVTDSGKFGRRATSRLGTLADLDVLVTDADLSPALRALTETAGVELVLAESGQDVGKTSDGAATDRP